MSQSVLVALSLAMSASPGGFPYDTGSWKAPLHEKALHLEQMVLDRHNIEGLYPSQVTVADGQADHTTRGHADVAHSVCWTSYYLVGAVLRWKVTGAQEDLGRVKEVFHGIHRCHEVNGVPGLISRGYVYGHGPSYEERKGGDRWWQGEGEFSRLRWRGNPSHHNHSAYFRAMGIAWAHIDDPEIRQIVRDDCLAIGRYVFLEHDMKVPDVDGKVTCDLMAWPPHDAPSTHGLMVTSALKVIALATEDPDLTAYYERMIAKLRYRAFASKPIKELHDSLVYGGTDHDDGEHAFAHLYNMVLLETDEELLTFYRNFADALWLMHKDDKQALYNVTYAAVSGKDGRLDDAVWWLRHYPTNKYHQPRMNSVRPDINELPKPLPLSERPFDNEYDFKGNPYQLDGWTARTIVDVAASPADPMIVYACDSAGFVYRSLDGGATWEDSFEGLAGARARKVLASPNTIQLVLAATDRGLYRSSNAGITWSHVSGSQASALSQDPADVSRAYAVVNGAVQESVPFGSAHWGAKWRPSGGESPPVTLRNVFIVTTGDGVRFLAQDASNTLWQSHPGADQWVEGTRPLGGRVAFSSVSAAGDTLLGVVQSPQALVISKDRGENWVPCGRKIGWWGTDGALSNVNVVTAALDPHDAGIVYAGSRQGCHVSRDGGDTWSKCTTGLAIPVVQALTVDSATGRLYAGTPGGLYVTSDQSVTWAPGNLVPIFHGLQLVETGPADYLIAYWMARHHGFLSQEATSAPWSDSVEP